MSAVMLTETHQTNRCLDQISLKLKSYLFICPCSGAIYVSRSKASESVHAYKAKQECAGHELFPVNETKLN